MSSMFSLAGGPFCERKSHLASIGETFRSGAALVLGVTEADAGLLRRPAGPLTGSC